MQNVCYKIGDTFFRYDGDIQDDIYSVIHRTMSVRCDCCGAVVGVFTNSHREFSSNLKWNIFADGDIVYCPKCGEVKHGADIGV